MVDLVKGNCGRAAVVRAFQNSPSGLCSAELVAGQ